MKIHVANRIAATQSLSRKFLGSFHLQSKIAAGENVQKSRHRLLDWSFDALILVFPVIWYFIFGSWFKSQLSSLVSGVKGLLRGLVPISRKKKRCPHHERHARAKAKDRVWRWRRQALPVALVVRCRRRSSNKAPRLVADISEPVRWKWKKKKVGLSSSCWN